MDVGTPSWFLACLCIDNCDEIDETGPVQDSLVPPEIDLPPPAPEPEPLRCGQRRKRPTWKVIEKHKIPPVQQQAPERLPDPPPRPEFGTV